MSGKDLYYASVRGYLTEVKRLLDSGAEVNWQDVVYYIILYYTILYSDVHCSD